MTQESLLALARAVYGADAAWTIDRVDQRQVSSGQGSTLKFFDPEHNDAQAMAVLCWLLEVNKQGKQIFVTTNSVRCWTYDEDGEDIVCWNEWHKNTPASLRAAIVRAAGRVVAG